MAGLTPSLGNPQNTIEILNKYRFVFQKKYGQNFLIDSHVLDKIIRAAEITEEDYVVEIGPGIGTMTQYLAAAAKGVTAIEIDRALLPILQDTLQGYDNVEIINEDVLKVDLRKLAEEKHGGRPVKVVANLPYYITTRIKGLWGTFSCSAVLCQALCSSKCAAQLLYAKAEGGFCGDPFADLRAAAGEGKG